MAYLFKTISWIILALSLPFSAAASDRFALVIGNASYGDFSDLNNPLNDASDIASTLSSLGYAVTRHVDLEKHAMEQALREFRNESAGAKHAIIYFAGHGVEIERKNYLIPTDASLKSDLDIEFETVPLSLLERSVQGATELQLILLDACRDNPFLNTMAFSNGTSRSIGRGLADIEPSGSSLIFYAARHGTVANDGVGRNSPFARALLAALNEPNLEVGQLVRRVRDDVLEATSHVQEPFFYGTLSSRQVFLNQKPIQPKSEDDRIQSSSSEALELAFWQATERGGTDADYRDYLSQFPEGKFRSIAERRLAKLDSQVPSLSKDEETSASDTQKLDEVPFLMTKELVHEIQERLNAGGYSPGQVDGILGNRTVGAAGEFSVAYGLTGNGRIDHAFVAELRRQVTDAMVLEWKRELASKQRATAKSTIKSEANLSDTNANQDKELKALRSQLEGQSLTQDQYESRLTEIQQIRNRLKRTLSEIDGHTD